MRTPWYLLAFAALLAAAPSHASGMKAFEGTITTFDNVTSEGLLFAHAKAGASEVEPIPETVRLRVKNAAGEMQSYEIQTSAIAKIIYSGRELGKCGGSRDHGTYYKTAQVVVLADGREYEQETCTALLMHDNAIYVSSRNPITGELSYDRVHWTKVKELRLAPRSGQVRKDAQGRTFPSDYLYSPYTGRKMELVSVD